MNNFPSMFASDKERPSGKGLFLVADLESRGFLRATRRPNDIHIITVRDYYSQDYWVFFDPIEMRQNPTPVDMEGEQDGYILDGVKMLMECEAFCWQNGVGFDMMVMEQCFPDIWSFNYLQPRMGMPNSDVFPFKFMDSMIVSQLTYPDRPLDRHAYVIGEGNTGPHSIAAHGIRMRRYKPDHEDWSTLSDDMIHRNIEDTEIGQDFLRYLMEGDWAEQMARGSNGRTGFDLRKAYAMELQVAMMIARQEMRGFRFDMEVAFKDWQEMDAEMHRISDLVAPYIPPKLETKPYSIDLLKLKSAALRKSKMLDKTPLTTLAEWGIHTSAGINELFKDIHMTQARKGELGRIGERATQWDLTKANGDYTSALQKCFPEMRGNVNDTKDPLVAGPFTPVTYEVKGLGGLDWVKEMVLYPLGWRGVNYSDSEQAWVDEHGSPRDTWSGKIDDDSVKLWKERMEVPEWAESLASWYILRSRRSQILNAGDFEYFKDSLEKGEPQWPKQTNGRRECRGLLAVAYCREYDMTAMEYYAKFHEWPSSYDEEWRVPAAAFSIGTNTFRMRHKFVVNIPSRGLRPLRHLFIAKNGYKILGCDGAGLELRMLAHFMADAVYQEIILHGDIHTHNQLKANLPTRDMAKTFIYAFLYGSGVGGLARLAGISEAEMQRCIDNFKRELPSLSRLIEQCEEAGKRFGYLHAIDGRWGRIRKKNGKILVHTVLNVLLQMTGSLIMKYGEVIAEDRMLAEGVALDERGWPAFVANVHDEVQMEVLATEVEETHYEMPYTIEGFPDERKAIKAVWDAEEKREHIADGKHWSAPEKLEAANGIIKVRRQYHRAGQILCESFAEAGIIMKMRTPLAGEYKVGNNWHDTH